jgi:aspartate/methionine/tyrosine aminotransferase
MPEQGASRRVSSKAGRFTESVIREMTRLAERHDAINLAQGFPDFPAPQFIKEAAHRAIDAEFNQYAVTWGSPRLRHAIAEKYARHYDWQVDPEREITVCCGATESMISSILALVDPDEQVAVFEPFYENYGPDTVIAGARPVFVPLDPASGWAFQRAALESRIQDADSRGGLRALILNSPNNPTGRVFTHEELECIAELAQAHDFYVITDEIYEHITYDGHHHRPLALFPGMRDRTVTISGLSKTFSVTGWRLGYVIAPPDLTGAIRKVHDFLTVGAPAPLQEAAATALRIGAGYYEELAEGYRRRRDLLLGILTDAGLKTWTPSGAYYIMADISDLTDETDVQFVHRMIREYGVAAVPGSSFFSQPELGHHLVRFTFCKSEALLEEVGRRLNGR